MASFDATPQHTLEQYSLPIWRSRLPTHWTKQMRSGGWPLDGRSSRCSDSITSRSGWVTTSGNS